MDEMAVDLRREEDRSWDALLHTLPYMGTKRDVVVGDEKSPVFTGIILESYSSQEICLVDCWVEN